MLRLLFGSEARVRILSLFLTHPADEYYLRQVGRLLDLAPHAVRQELNRLVQLGILKREDRSNHAYFGVNRNCPIYPELKALFLKTAALGDRLRAALESFTDIDIAFIHGSVAADTETLESDIDLFIVGSVMLSHLAPVLTDVEAAIDREINASVFSAQALRTRVDNDDAFIASVLSEPKIFVVGNEEVLNRLVR